MWRGNVSLTKSDIIQPQRPTYIPVARAPSNSSLSSVDTVDMKGDFQRQKDASSLVVGNVNAFETSPPQHHIADSNVAFVTVEVLNTSYLGNARLMSLDMDFLATQHICSSLSGFACSDARPPFRRQGTSATVVREFNRYQFVSIVQSTQRCDRLSCSALQQRVVRKILPVRGIGLG